MDLATTTHMLTRTCTRARARAHTHTHKCARAAPRRAYMLILYSNYLIDVMDNTQTGYTQLQVRGRGRLACQSVCGMPHGPHTAPLPLQAASHKCTT